MRVVFIVVVMVFSALAAEASPIPNPKNLPEDLLVKDMVEGFFSSTKTLRADFTQIDARGNVGGGKFLLKRPGKFRWEYDKRQPLLIISNGENLVYRDNELDETTYVAADDTLASFLARPQVRLEGDITLYDAFVDADFIKVRIGQTDKPEDGQLALYLSKDAKKLLRMDVIDSADYKTVISFSNQEYGVELAEKNFVYYDKKFKKNVWEK